MEDGASLFRPDYFRPSQWRDLHTSGDDPVQNLLLAVLEQALRDLIGVGKISVRRRQYKSTAFQRERAATKHSQRASALRRDAREWIFGGGDGPFSFVNVCDTLGIDGEALRVRVSGRNRRCRSAAKQLSPEREKKAKTEIDSSGAKVDRMIRSKGGSGVTNCVECDAKLGAKRRIFREVTERPYRICQNCGRAQPHSIEFNPASGAVIDEAAKMYDKFRSLFDRMPLRILVWGPDPNSDSPAAKKRNELRDRLGNELGYHVYYSEELIFDRTFTVPGNLQERIQVSEMDAVVCIGSDFGPIQEATEFGQVAKEFLLWLSDRARGTYSDSAIARSLQLYGRKPLFFRDEDLESCVVASVSTEWVSRIRMKNLAIDMERNRLDRIRSGER
jgi:hypothetical protein